MDLPWDSTPMRPRSRCFTRAGGSLAIAAVLLCSTASGEAQLSWTQHTIEQQATAFDGTTAFAFAFTNDGDYPVTITSLASSCGCTTAALAQDRYAPGEDGIIEAIFDIGDRRGPQAKTLTVRTDDPRNPVVTLAVKLDIAEVIELQPRMLLWRKGEPRIAKTAQILVHRPDLLVLENIEATDPDFTLTWNPPPPPEILGSGKEELADAPSDPGRNPEEAEAPNEEELPTVYRVVVQPPADGSAQKAVLNLHPETPLPEGVTLPRLVVRTLGPPAPASDD